MNRDRLCEEGRYELGEPRGWGVQGQVKLTIDPIPAAIPTIKDKNLGSRIEAYTSIYGNNPRRNPHD